MKRALIVIVVLVCACPALVGLALMSGAAAGDESLWCPPGGGDLPGLDSEQSQHARTITAVGGQLGVPERGMVVALAAAAAESSLRNLTGGDRDSVGLFQQRGPWGTVKERTTPTIAATFFFTGGSGGQPGLVDIAGWETLPVGDAAQAVQRSAHPDAYAQWENDAWSWLAAIRGSVTPTTTTGDCPDSGHGDGEDPSPLVADLGALQARAQAFVDASAAGQPDPFFGAFDYYRQCARLAARVHGHPNSGFITALAQWQHYVSIGAAVTDGSPPPPGALLFYTNPPSGHVAVYLGDGMVISNDILDQQTGRRGGVYIVDAIELVDGAWQLPYAGWAPPFYL